MRAPHLSDNFPDRPISADTSRLIMPGLSCMKNGSALIDLYHNHNGSSYNHDGIKDRTKLWHVQVKLSVQTQLESILKSHISMQQKVILSSLLFPFFQNCCRCLFMQPFTLEIWQARWREI